MTIRYKGFSTVDRVKKFRLNDFELVKQDLINHFRIEKGDKLMNPAFGTIIWSMLYEPLTDDVRATIIDDVKRVVNYDPRLDVESVLIDDFEHGIQIQIDLVFLPGNFASSLRLEFNSNSKDLIVL